MLNLASILEDSTRRYPAKPAFTFRDNSFTYAEINMAANKVANGLIEKGIRPGDKVALSCLNLPQFPIIYFGILKAGAIVVPLSVLLKKEEIEYHLRDSDAKAYFCYTGTPEIAMGEMGYAAFKAVETCTEFILVMPTASMPAAIEGTTTLGSFMMPQSADLETYLSNGDDTCVIIYTSGTTGRPKGAELTHSNLLLNALISCDLMSTNSTDVSLIVLPLFHIFGMTVLMNAGVLKGCTNVLLPRFDAETAFDLMQKHKVTLFAGVPTMYWGLLHYNDPKFDYDRIAANLKSCVSGGASLPLQVIEDFERRFNVPIIEGYGMSEGSPVVTFNRYDTIRKPGSVGTPVWGVEVKLIDHDGLEVPVGEKGELLYRGHNVMKGYYKKPEETAKALQNGWLHSGDIAIKDEDGFYFIVDRTKDMINRGGYKVYPREIEEVMITHEAVSLVAVIGIPHYELGEEVKAFVVLNAGQNITEIELISWTKEKVATYKYPRHVEFLAALPMSATGKILKKELRK
ncbi:long-chain-fatty-acid--CoA ligase [Flavihumibacter fluvii]|uniref:long-chain-fatty-acid--CoA ligase n=1 Tax=Flavihumibacter fluvii TaxID=2838157 RepID=UPI001BDE0434|nr:long-chain fatty acid--CoA ligase [Flavihumibacter fluvii]ULQ54726.1 long-chain fatty acid--CoA ligase [Flavihumibacter fluvii]